MTIIYLYVTVSMHGTLEEIKQDRFLLQSTIQQGEQSRKGNQGYTVRVKVKNMHLSKLETWSDQDCEIKASWKR